MTAHDSWFAALEARAKERHAHSRERLGQAYFNALYFDGFDPEFADSIRGGPLDPFHDSGRIAEMLDALTQRRAADNSDEGVA